MKASNNSFPECVENAGVVAVDALGDTSPETLVSIARTPVTVVWAVKFKLLTDAPLTVADCDAGMKLSPV